MASCPAYGAPICSLCCTLESRCHDRCKTDARAADQVRLLLARLLPARLSALVNFRVAHYLVVAVSLIALLAVILGVVYDQQEALHGGGPSALRNAFWQAFALLSLVAAVGAWGVVLGSESRRLAEEESSRQNQLLTQEIDAHRRTDAALQAAKDLAEAANAAKTRYVTGMTHELRTPLNSILGYSQILLKDEQLPTPTRSALETMHHSGEHMHGLIDGLLDLARIEAGKLRLDIAPLAMPEFLDDLARMVAPQAAAKGLQFELERIGAVPAFVRADARRLRQILINLLGNAVRFTERGRVTLTVDFSREVTRFQVTDTGIGIAPQDLERIFLPFERGSGGRRSGEPGTGLGLTITHLLTQLMGGDLNVQSQVGQGSSFSVRLYLPETSEPADGSRIAPRPVSGYIGERRTLLVVDDQPTQRQMLAGLLLPLGFRVREAASGHECLESVALQRPDALLLDISMDDMDGWETARRLRASGVTDMPIIMVSASAFENQASKLESVGCQAFVDKPVIESELLVVLQKQLQLEWVAELALPQWAPPLLRSVDDLPPEAAAELAHLARLGHALGLRTLLARLRETHPACQDSLDRLAAATERFAWQELIDLLQPSLRELADDEEGGA
jgi:signal transduction histidine kinase/CheY-like chemotaxis protein